LHISGSRNLLCRSPKRLRRLLSRIERLKCKPRRHRQGSTRKSPPSRNQKPTLCFFAHTTAVPVSLLKVPFFSLNSRENSSARLPSSSSPPSPLAARASLATETTFSRTTWCLSIDRSQETIRSHRCTRADAHTHAREQKRHVVQTINLYQTSVTCLVDVVVKNQREGKRRRGWLSTNSDQGDQGTMRK